MPTKRLDPSLKIAEHDGQLPTQSAMIHRLIDAASPAARERLLVLFFGELFS